MIYNLDVCHAVVECTPAPKATKDMRKRKIAHRRFEQWCRPGWVTLACMADPFIVCIVAVLITISNLRNQQEWSRNKDAHPITKQYVYCDMLHCKKVDGTCTRHKPRIVASVEHCNARNVYTYLHTILFILCHWPVATAAVIATRLLLAGDIELNPGPLTTSDLRNVRKSVWDARTKWYDIGIELEIDVSVLDAIKHDNDDAGSRLTAMLTNWLKRTTPSPNWEALVNALKSPTVGCERQAEDIEKKYCDRGVPPHSGTWQSGSQFPRQASSLCPSPQQPHGKYQAILAPSQGEPIPTKKLLMKELYSTVASKWHPIGTFLEIPDGELNTIAERDQGDPQKCLMAMLGVWLHRTDPPASWSDIADAVEVIGMSDIAQQIRRKYCMHGFQQGAQLPQCVPSQYTPAPSSQAAGNMADDAHFSHSMSESRDTFKANTKTESMDVLSSCPSFQKLSSSEKEELKAMLDDDEEKMKLHFGRMVTKTCDSVEKQTTVVKFAGSILALGAYDPAPEVQDRSLLHEHREEIKGAKTISDIFIILSAYWNYLNYEILKYIIELYATSEVIERLEDYNEKLHDFCKRRIFELPESSSETGNVQNEKQAKFVMKLDVQENVTCKEVLQIRRRIAKILRINVAALIISQMDIGCVQLTFLIPKFVVQEVFPLSSEQISALSKDAFIISLECGSYSCKNTSKAYTEDVATESLESLELEELKEKNQPPVHHLVKAQAKHPDDDSAERQRSDIADTDATGQSFAGVPDASELNSTPRAGQSAADATDDSEASSTPLGRYSERLKSRYTSKPKYSQNQWPPQGAKTFFNLALIKEETVRKGEISDEFTRLTITGKLDDILQIKKPIKLHEIFNETDDRQKMTVLLEGPPGGGKTVLTLHLCLEWVKGKLFEDYKLVILVRLREPAIHKAKEIKDILPLVEMEDVEMQDVAKEIVSNRGSGVLFIMDGWDELPKDIEENHIIRQIIVREVLSEGAVVITSRPTSSATLHRHLKVSSHIEILGFTPSELHEYFTEHLDGNSKAAKADKADKLMLKIRANPTVAGTCTLPLNAAILVHIFDCDGDLPTTEHGIFESLIRNCIHRHLKEREPQHEVKAIKSLYKPTPKVQDQYNELCKVAYEGVMDDRVIFELSEHFNTLGLLQGVECYTSYGTEYFYNFLHLSIQEFLAAQYIATFEAAKQVAEFNKLFGQARFASTFRHYSAITKLATPGIKEIVLRILKRCAADNPSGEDKTHLLSLLNCLHEAQEPALYAFVADNLGPKLNLQNITLNPADCLSINCFLRNVTEIEVNLWNCSIGDEGVKMLFSEDQVYQLRSLILKENEISPQGCEAIAIGLKHCTKLEYLNLSYNHIEIRGALVAMEKMVHLQELNLSGNELGDEGVQMAMEKMVHFQELDLSGDEREAGRAKPAMKKLTLSQCRIGDGGMKLLSTCMEKMVNLQELHLQFNGLTDGCIGTLIDIIKTAKSLKTVYIEGNKIQDECATALTDALRMKGNQSLNTPNQNVQAQQSETDHSEPKFPSTEWKSLMIKISPVILDIQQADETTKNAVQLFAKQVVLILHTCNQSEYWAALERLKPPTREDDGEIKARPIQYSQDGSVMGWFAGYRAAVVRTEQGTKGRSVLTKALTKSFPNGQVIIGTGIAYANDQKCNLADVLISEQYTVSGGAITNHDLHQQIDPNVMKVFKDPANDWSAKKSFTCANNNRTSVAHIGHIVSVSSLEMLREQLLLAPNSIGGEIEGWVLFELKKMLKVQNEKDIEIIIIHGVSEYHNLTMGDKWQWTAAKAAIDCIHYCLIKSGGTEFNAMNIAREEAREQHYEAYQQALKDEAAIPLKYLKVLFFGPPRTGKTSMRRRLIGEIQNLAKEPVQVSTGTAEHYDVIIKEDKNTAWTTLVTESKWSSIKVLCGKEKNTHLLDEELRLLYQLISKTQNKSHHIQTEDKPLDENSSPVSPNENSPSKGNESLNQSKSPVRDKQQSPVKDKEKVSGTKTTESNSNTSVPWVGQEHEHSAEYIERKEIDKEFEAFDQFLRESGEGQNKDLQEGTILMNMVDTGGQPAFLEMLPALTMGPALYLIFFRLNQELKQTYEIQYVSKDTEAVPLGDSSYTVEDVIFQALSSITCFSCASPKKDNMPVPSHAAVLVGTHKDKLESDTDAKVKAKDDVLRKNLDNILKCDFHKIDQTIVHSFSDKQLVFAIDNMTGDNAELTSVRKRLQQIIEQMFQDRKFAIPASWLMFSIFLRKMGTSIMNLSQCRMIGERLNVSDTDEALWFLHHCVGVLMHFPEVNEIKDVVICNPQIVFDSVTYLILDSFRIESVHDSVCNKFKEAGQFQFKDIQKIPESTGDSLSLPKLVKLLKYLNIISPITPEGSSPQSDVVYFMPAVLRYAKEGELSMKQRTTDQLPPLMIHFKCGFVPVGVFCAKIASLVSQGWELCDKSGNILCKNIVTFRMFDGTYDITLISIPKWFEIHISRIAAPDRPLHEICQIVLETVCNTLDQVISKMNYGQVFCSDETPYELGFKCPKHLNDDHLAINKPRYGVEVPSKSSKSLWLWLNYHEGKSIMKCDNERMKVEPIDQSLVWFGKGISVNITQHPEHQSVTTGANIKFHVEATGHDVLQFQWQKDGSDMDSNEPRFQGDRTSTLQIRCVEKSDEGHYKCLVKYFFEKSGKPSSEAKLRVCLESESSFSSLTPKRKHPTAEEIPEVELIGGTPDSAAGSTSSSAGATVPPVHSSAQLSTPLTSYLQPSMHHQAPPSHQGQQPQMPITSQFQQPMVTSVPQMQLQPGNQYPPQQGVLGMQPQPVYNQPTMYSAQQHMPQPQPYAQTQHEVQPFQHPQFFASTTYPQQQQTGQQGYGMPQQNVTMQAPQQMQSTFQPQIPPGMYAHHMLQFYFQPAAQVPMQQQQQAGNYPIPHQQQNVPHAQQPFPGSAQAGHIPQQPPQSQPQQVSSLPPQPSTSQTSTADGDPGNSIRRGDKPVLTKLLKFPGRRGKINIPEQIGTNYKTFGIFLLRDDNGTIISGIERAKMHAADEINETILERWISGKGQGPLTWDTLVKCLRDTELNVLADEIEEVLR